MSDAPPKASVTTIDMRKLSGWILGLGIVMIILGLVALVANIATTIATIIFFGVLLLIAGGSQIAQAFFSPRWQGFLWHLLCGILYCFVGVVFLKNPLEGAVSLTVLIGIFFLINGAFRSFLAIQAMGSLPGAGWYLMSGLLNVAIGVMVLVGWPGTSLWVIGLLVGIELFFTGVVLTMVGIGLRSATPTS